MRTDNRDSEKDLNANPDSKLNTNKPISKPDATTGSRRPGSNPERFPESQQARDEMERQDEMERSTPVGEKDDEKAATLTPQPSFASAHILHKLRRAQHNLNTPTPQHLNTPTH